MHSLSTRLRSNSACFPIKAAFSLSRILSLIAFASASAFPHSTITPFYPELISSLAPPGEQSVETHGSPIAIASIKAFGIPS